MEFKDALRRRRINLGLSEQQLANLITRYGSPTTGADVVLWERGRNFPPLELPEFRQALAAALQTTVDRIEKGMRLALKAAEPELTSPPPQPVWSVDAIRAAELIDSMPTDLRLMALAVLNVMLNTYAPVMPVSVREAREVREARDFWGS